MKSIYFTIVITLFFCLTINPQTNIFKKQSLEKIQVSKVQVRYFYFPNLCVYYDKVNLEYIFQEHGVWIKAKKLPTLYGGYSLYHNYRVEIDDYDGDNPQEYIKNHKKLYPYSSKGRFIYKNVVMK